MLFQGRDRNKNIIAPHDRALTVVCEERGSGFQELVEKYNSRLIPHKKFHIFFTFL